MFQLRNTFNHRKRKMNSFKKTVSAIAVSVALAACGGGGGTASAPASPAPAPVPSPAPTPSATPANLQLTVPALTYATVSAEYAFVSGLNQFRESIGLGLLAQNDLLDKAAGNHLQYVNKNSTEYGGPVNMAVIDPGTHRSQYHIENSAYPLYTGVQELERARFAGYSGEYVGEELTFAGGKGGKVALESLVATVYHRAGLMIQSVRDVGVSVGSDQSQTVVLEMGLKSRQTNASNFVGVYPADKQTGISLHTYVETPNPFPELSTATDDFPTKTGYPVSVVVKEGVALEVQSFIMTESGAAAPLAGRVLTENSDPNRLLSSNVAFFIASSKLKPNTTYTVTFAGKADNVAIAKNWSFVTGN